MTGLGGKNLENENSLYIREKFNGLNQFSEKMYIHVYRHSSTNDMI